MWNSPSEDFTGIDAGYDYRELPLITTDEEILKYCNGLREKWAKLTRNWSEAANTEWMSRCYLCLRLIGAATIMLSSRKFAEKANLRIVGPYLGYYAALTCSRAFLLIDLDRSWKEGNLFKLTHKDTIKLITDSTQKLNKSWGKNVGDIIERLRDDREMFSYTFPLEAPIFSAPSNSDLSRMLRCICELCQIHSECMHSAIKKQNIDRFSQLDDLVAKAVLSHEVEDKLIGKEDDVRRFEHLFRKIGRPINLYHMCSNGLVDDLFGNYVPEDCENIDSCQFDPWDSRTILFDFE